VRTEERLEVGLLAAKALLLTGIRLHAA
jgi:hypothetical protein